MGSKWPSAQSLEDSDFYARQRSSGLRVQAWFEPGGNDLHSAWYEYAAEGRGETGGRVQYKPDGTAYKLTGECKDRFPLVYIGAERSFEQQFGTSRWTLFGQAIRHLEEHFEANVGTDVKCELGRHLDAAQAALKTDLYESFVGAVGKAFTEQLRHTRHSVELGFRAFDPLHFYRSLQPFLTEDGERKGAAEAGSGLRNLIVLALFRAYGQTFRGDAVVAIEEPEMYLHPHAQRGLMRMFREISNRGTQIIYSTHSSAFVSVERFDEVVIVERCPDDFEEVRTTVRQLSGPELVARHQRNRPQEAFRLDGIRARYRHNCGPEHTEALFGRVVVLVEGATEAAALPLYAEDLGLNLDASGVSVVNARGKDSLESLYHLYTGLGFPVFVIFDNDVGKASRGAKDKENQKTANRRLTRLLGLAESDEPEAEVGETYAIMDGDFEKTLRAEIEAFQPGLYDTLSNEAGSIYASSSKPIAARHVAEYLGMVGFVPPTVRHILRQLAVMVGAEIPPPAPTDEVAAAGMGDDLPF